ncbi:MAG TPA: hypothetical protein GX734_06415 [Clostridiaceae bacterium]|nr:hypothetical protein [Clostridiaceae bacterium]
MESVRILDLKRVLFYYFLSWRISLLCIFICVALAIGLVYLRPAKSQAVDESVVEQEEPSPAEKRAQFVAENAEAKVWAAEIAKLEGEKALLESELANSLFLQIDPECRINKYFDLRFSYFMVDFEDEAEKTRIDQILCLMYLKQLSGDRYMKHLATTGLLKFKQAALVDLVDVSVNQDGYIEFMVTGPEEVVIDQLIDSTKEYLQLVIRPEIDLLATHFLTISVPREEVVKEPSVVPLKKRIENDILIKNTRIDEINHLIDTAFEESLNREEIESPNSDASAEPSRKSSLMKGIVFGVLLGLFISAFVTVVQYRRNIMRIDVTAITREYNISYLGVVPYYSQIARSRNKRFGNSIDRFFIKLFGMAYDPDNAASLADYVVQLLRGIVDARIENGENAQPTFNILVPNVIGDVSVGGIVTYIRRAFEKDSGKKISLQEGGSFECDPNTIEAAHKCSGLLLLSKSSDKITSMDCSIRRSADLSKEILGVIEMDERW